MFDHIILEPEQKELLSVLVEAARNIPRDKRQKFMFAELVGQGGRLNHPGLPGLRLKVYRGDIEALGREGLVALSHGQHGTLLFDVTPQGFRYYEEMKQQLGEPIQRMEASTMQYIDSTQFQQKYSTSYQKWAEAERLLWSSDSQQQLTTIGHHCREALQEFATALLNRHSPPEVDGNRAHTANRIRAVLDQNCNQLGSTEKAFLEALLEYWRRVSDLVQRQVHGGQKEGEPLVWDDGYRVVFQTMVVMFEVDRSLSRGR